MKISKSRIVYNGRRIVVDDVTKAEAPTYYDGRGRIVTAEDSALWSVSFPIGRNMLADGDSDFAEIVLDLGDPNGGRFDEPVVGLFLTGEELTLNGPDILISEAVKIRPDVADFLRSRGYGC